MATPTHRDIEANLDKQVRDAIKKLNSIPKEFRKKERKKMLRKASKPLIAAAKSNIKDSKIPVHRYSTGKVVQSIRAPKGSGTILATYIPGNLKESIKVLPIRKSWDIFIGPKVAKRNNKGTFGTKGKVDGWYAHFVEFGTVHQDAQNYMRNAVDTTKRIVQKNIIQEVKKTLQRFINKHKLK